MLRCGLGCFSCSFFRVSGVLDSSLSSELRIRTAPLMSNWSNLLETNPEKYAGFPRFPLSGGFVTISMPSRRLFSLALIIEVSEADFFPARFGLLKHLGN